MKARKKKAQICQEPIRQFVIAEQSQATGMSTSGFVTQYLSRSGEVIVMAPSEEVLEAFCSQKFEAAFCREKVKKATLIAK